MRSPPVPVDEAERLACVMSLKILDTPAEERYDRITRLARRVFGVPIAIVTILDAERQWFKSVQGLDRCQTGRNISFCGHAILHPQAMVINDTLKDERFFDNPLVTGEPHIRFYAGQPIAGPGGHMVGVICIIDQKPRDFSGEDVLLLGDLGRIVEQEIVSCRMSDTQLALVEKLNDVRLEGMVDGLTRLWNRKAIDQLLVAEVERAERGKCPFALIMGDLDHFKAVNDTFGHPMGDAVLREVATRLRRAARAYDVVGRYGGEEFLLALPNSTREEANVVCQRMLSYIAKDPVVAQQQAIDVTISLGGTVLHPGTALSVEALIRKADAALYTSKNNGRNRVTFVP